MVMGLVGWMVLGLVAGYIAQTRANRDDGGLPLSMGVGISGAVLGGWLFTAFGPAGGTGLSLWSLAVAGIGAVVLLGVWHAIRRSAWDV